MVLKNRVYIPFLLSDFIYKVPFLEVIRVFRACSVYFRPRGYLVSLVHILNGKEFGRPVTSLYITMCAKTNIGLDHLGWHNTNVIMLLMIQKEIYKKRGNIIQAYPFAAQQKYLKYKRNDKFHEYVRDILLKENYQSAYFNEEATSASSSIEYHAVTEEGELFYPVKKELESIPFEVKHYPNGTHRFSQWVLESGGYYNKKDKMDFLQDNQYPVRDYSDSHYLVQEWLLKNGYAEAIELPAWIEAGERKWLDIRTTKGEQCFMKMAKTTTCFIDAVFRCGDTLWLYDYKPDAKSAKNKHAVSQLLTCRDLLNYRTGLKNIKCAYGDHIDTYVLML